MIEVSTGGQLLVGIFIFVGLVLFIFYALRALELAYVLRHRRPFFVHYPFLREQLAAHDKTVLVDQFSFFNKLSLRHQAYFEHRVAVFINEKLFIGRGNLVVTDEMKVLVSATAVMLTFGFRNYSIDSIVRIFIYPDVFYSDQNEAYHKGEFNPKLKSLVLSWRHFVDGFKFGDDNVNLGIHEFAHAIHLNSLKKRDLSATIFSDSFQGLITLLAENQTLRQELLASQYFRDYAYTNSYEFVAVIIETFIETPQDFKQQFPEIYNKVRQMLNFRFAGY